MAPKGEKQAKPDKRLPEATPFITSDPEEGTSEGKGKKAEKPKKADKAEKLKEEKAKKEAKADKLKEEKAKKEEKERAKKEEKEEKERAKKEEKAKKEKKAKKSSSVAKVKSLEEAGRRGSLVLAQLEKEEELFFEKVEAGNVSDVERFLDEHRNLNLNCVNFCGVSAVHVAIENKDLGTVKLLFQRPDLEMRDAALHAVATGDTDFAAAVLDLIKNISPEREMRGCDDSPDYMPDVTPLALAAQNGDYKMVRMLIERGHEISKPHVPDCLCPACKTVLREAGSSVSRIRLNAYKAIANPAYICQVTDDPILYSFQVDNEMDQCSLMDKEFRAEYVQMGEEVRDFTVQLLSQCRDTSEVEMLLKLPWGYDDISRLEFPRVQLALDFKQKEFVAHSLVQQILTAHWLGEFRSWPRLSLFYKVLHCFVRMLVLPFLCLALIIVPWIRPLKKYRSPLNRFLLNLVSYLTFLTIVFLLNHLDTGRFEKGPPRTGCEAVVVIYVIGHIWATIRQLWVDGGKRFFRALWNWYDMLMELVFVLTFIFWLISHLDVMADQQHKRKSLERKFWRSDDASLLHEGFFAVGTVLAFGKLAYYCLQSSRLGPLQVSMGKMALQIGYFLVLCLIINTAFSNTLTRMYAYYDGMKQTDKDGNERTQLSTFSTFGHSFLTLFWGMFGMSPAESADVVVENLSDDAKNPIINNHNFTEGVGRSLFATYELIMIIALVNTLIAILSNTFQRVVDNADVEFKFARARLWARFFDESTLLPPPFNLFPTSNFFINCTTYFRALANNIPGGKARCSVWRCCYVEYEKEQRVDTVAYEVLMSSLVQRYFRSKEQEEE